MELNSEVSHSAVTDNDSVRGCRLQNNGQSRRHLVRENCFLKWLISLKGDCECRVLQVTSLSMVAKS